MFTKDYYRGVGDASKFDFVRRNLDGSTVGVTGGDTTWFLSPVSDAYLDGLRSGGCAVIVHNPPKFGLVDKLRELLTAELSPCQFSLTSIFSSGRRSSLAA